MKNYFVSVVRLLIAGVLFALVAACGGGGDGHDHGTIVVVNPPPVTPAAPVFEQNVPPVLRVRNGYPQFVTVSTPAGTTHYMEIIVDSMYTTGNPKILAADQNGFPVGPISVTDSNGVAVTTTVGFTDTSHTAIRTLTIVDWNKTYAARLTLYDVFNNPSTVSVQFTTPPDPTPPTTPNPVPAFAIALRSEYPLFSVLSPAAAFATIIVDSTVQLQSAPNGKPMGTFFVSDSVNAVSPTAAVGADFTDPGRTAVRLTATASRATSYTATFTLESVAGERRTLLVPFTMP